MTLFLLIWRSAAGVARVTVAVARARRASLAKRLARRRTAAALSGLDSRILKDIGLHRTEILSVAYGQGVDRMRSPAHG